MFQITAGLVILVRRYVKPNQVIPKARLQQVAAFDEALNRIIIDCVGPLPKTKSGNE